MGSDPVEGDIGSRQFKIDQCRKSNNKSVDNKNKKVNFKICFDENETNVPRVKGLAFVNRD